MLLHFFRRFMFETEHLTCFPSCFNPLAGLAFQVTDRWKSHWVCHLLSSTQLCEFWTFFPEVVIDVESCVVQRASSFHVLIGRALLPMPGPPVQDMLSCMVALLFSCNLLELLKQSPPFYYHPLYQFSTFSFCSVFYVVLSAHIWPSCGCWVFG